MELKYKNMSAFDFPKIIPLRIILDTLPILDPNIVDPLDYFTLSPGEDGYIELHHTSYLFGRSQLVAELGDLTDTSQRDLHEYLYHRLKYVIWVEELV